MKKNWRSIVTFLVLVFSFLVIITVIDAFAAANTVPLTRADKNSIGLGVNELQPPECVGLGLTNIVDIGAGETGTSANDLILGTANSDSVIRGGAGNDCILGGAGNERRWFIFFWIPGIFGDEGNDVIIGGPGTDVCYGGAGTDTYYSCETIY